MPNPPMPNKHRQPDVVTPTLFPRGTTIVLARILALVVAVGALFGGLYLAGDYFQGSREEEVQELIVPRVTNTPVTEVVRGLERAGFERVRVVDGRGRRVKDERDWTSCGTRPKAGTALPVNQQLILVAQSDELDCSGKKKR